MIPIISSGDTNPGDQTVETPGGTPDAGALAGYYHKRLPPEVKRYLEGRGLTQETIAAHFLGFDPGKPVGFSTDAPGLEGYFEGRLIIPITGPGGEVVDLVGLALEEGVPRLKTLSGRTQALFNGSVLGQKNTVFLCDDPFDALILEQVGFPAVALLGGVPADPEWTALFQGKSVFLVFTPGGQGAHAREVEARVLSTQAKDVYLLSLPEGIGSINELFLNSGQPLLDLTLLVNEAMSEGKYSEFSPDAERLVAFLEEFKKRNAGQSGGVPTGFPELDRILGGGLREGFYILAGTPSAGKTTFMRQLADQVASQSTPVLYFSLEMSAFELWAKSIARILRTPVSSVLSGLASPGNVALANQIYLKSAEYLWTIEGEEGITVGRIAEKIRQAAAKTGVPPVVFIDYLQRLTPGGNAEAISSVRARSLAALGLKRLSWGFGCPVIAAFSLTPHSLTRTGAEVLGTDDDVQHSADVIAVLRPVNDGPETALVALEVVKNRYGATGQANLTFHKAHGLFQVAEGSTQ